jgi:anti-sigma factor RsiW
MNCSTIKIQLHAYLNGELAGIQKMAVAEHLRTCDSCRKAAEFDQYLREADDFYGDAPGLIVPPNFLSQVVKRAQAGVHPANGTPALKERKPLWNWFLEFGLPLRLAVASMLLLATVGGLRAGQVITDLITRSNEQKPQIITPDMIPAEQSLVMLMRSEGLIVTGQANGDQQ